MFSARVEGNDKGASHSKVCVCVCVHERERETERDGERESICSKEGGERKREGGIMTERRLEAR